MFVVLCHASNSSTRVHCIICGKTWGRDPDFCCTRGDSAVSFMRSTRVFAAADETREACHSCANLNYLLFLCVCVCFDVMYSGEYNVFDVTLNSLVSKVLDLVLEYHTLEQTWPRSSVGRALD